MRRSLLELAELGHQAIRRNQSLLLGVSQRTTPAAIAATFEGSHLRQLSLASSPLCSLPHHHHHHQCHEGLGFKRYLPPPTPPAGGARSYSVPEGLDRTFLTKSLDLLPHVRGEGSSERSFLSKVAGWPDAVRSNSSRSSHSLAWRSSSAAKRSGSTDLLQSQSFCLGDAACGPSYRERRGASAAAMAEGLGLRTSSYRSLLFPASSGKDHGVAEARRLGSGLRFQSSGQDREDLVQRFKVHRKNLAEKAKEMQRLLRKSATTVESAPQESQQATPDPDVDFVEYTGAPPRLTQPLIGELEPTCKDEQKMASIFARPDLIINRHIEWQNIILGFEQENRYEIRDPLEPQIPVGYIREYSNWILRQIMRTHRPFHALVLDYAGREVCKVRRPAFFINSVIYVECNGKVIGEARKRWHLWKRLYDAYSGKRQFAQVRNWGFWDWTFTLEDENSGVLAVIDRNFRGLGFEVFTDAGQYVVRFGDIAPVPSHLTLNPLAGKSAVSYVQAAASQIPPLEVVRPLTLTERAVTLALAVSLDNDYFSRMSGSGGMWIPFGIAAGEAI